MVPVIGDGNSALKNPKNPFVRAIASPVTTDSPIDLSMLLANSDAETPNRLARLTGTAFPGMSVLAITSCALTSSPDLTRTSPEIGNNRRQRQRQPRETINPGVYACAILKNSMIPSPG